MPSKASFLPELACFDIDGTLVDSDHKLGPGAKEAVALLQEHGVQIALASGRPSFAATSLAGTLGITGPSMFFSGSVIICPGSSCPLEAAPLSTEDIQSCLSLSQEHNWYTELYTIDGYFTPEPHELATIHEEYMGCAPLFEELRLVEEKHRGRIYKVQLAYPFPITQKELDLFEATFPHLSLGIAYGAAHPHITFVSVTSKEGSRHQAFSHLLKHTHSAQEKTIAFGDAESDIPFLQLAAIGIAMGNAKEHVKNEADFVTRSVSEGGVLHAVQELFGW